MGIYFETCQRKAGASSKLLFYGLIRGTVVYFSDRKPINARDDTLLTQRSMFDSAKDDGRCIVVAEGYLLILYSTLRDSLLNFEKFRFYEWKNVNGKKKIPYFTKRKDGKLMLFAGLCDTSNIDKSGML